MDNIEVFQNKEFGSIRTMSISSEIWFVGKDVCEAFGDTNYRRSLSNIDDSDKGVSQINTPGGKQNMVIINESGLYSLLFQMQPQKAKGVSQNDSLIQERIEKLHRFKRWVTSEVLPTIRKTGGYNKPMSTAEKIKLLAQGNEELNERVEKVEDKLDSLENDMPLYGCEIEELKNHISRRAISILDGKNSEAYKDASIRGTVYKDIYRQLKREYGYASSYKSLKRKYLADAHEFVDCYAAPTYLQEQITDANAQQSFT